MLIATMICPCWMLAAFCGAIGVVIGFIMAAVIVSDDGPPDGRDYSDDT